LSLAQGTAASFLLAGALVLAFRSALRPDPRTRLAAVFLCGLPLLSLPLLVPLGAPGSALVRWLVAVHCGVAAVKLWDLHRGFAEHGRPRLLAYLAFAAITTPFHLVFRRVWSEPGPGRRRNARRLARGALEIAAGVLALGAAFRADLGRFGFAADHTAKCLATYPVLDGICVFLAALFRLLGLPARDVNRDPILARTPAEWWRRYNRPVSQYFYEDVWMPAGGARAPARATLLCFLVSGLFHEYIFAVATVRITGYQVAFFALHGVAVVATARLRPRGWKAVAGALASNAFLVATLVFFAASVALLLRDLVTIYPHGGALP
jgi:hypothetical protein